jgi:hypothetical protein
MVKSGFEPAKQGISADSPAVASYNQNLLCYHYTIG